MGNRTLQLILAGLGVSVFLIFISWLLFFRPSTSQTNSPGGFGAPENSITGSADNASSSNNSQSINTGNQAPQQKKIFQITPGPVAGETLIQTLHPTTTFARFIRQEDGHVFDLPLDVPGAVPRIVSNVTIPGGVRSIWVEGGNAVMQYLDGDTVKTVYLGFPVSTSTESSVALPTRIRFLPDSIVDIAVSPDGNNVAYLLKTASGVDGYVSKADGTAGKKLFSLPLSQVLISWPSPSYLLVQTRSAAGVAGIAFSVDIKSGAATALVYAQGLTTTANGAFTTLLYQISTELARVSYIHDIKSGLEVPLPISPSPEQCVWSLITTNVLYCASPIQFVPAAYLDQGHLGLASAAENIFKIFTNVASISVVASPGLQNGGVPSDILEMSLSPDEHYLSFTNKGSRSVWGVRLTQ